jgi:hypothetical protein
MSEADPPGPARSDSGKKNSGIGASTSSRLLRSVSVSAIINDAARSSTHKLPPVLLGGFYGVPLSQIWSGLTESDRSGVERQVAEIQACVAQYRTTAFGPAVVKLPASKSVSWREAFQAMMFSLLNEGEDMYVNLPYDRIRDQVRKAGRTLDNVREAGLIVMHIHDAENILVDERTLKVNGVADTGKAFWGDPDMISEEAPPGRKRLLSATHLVKQFPITLANSTQGMIVTLRSPQSSHRIVGSRRVPRR